MAEIPLYISCSLTFKKYSIRSSSEEGEGEGTCSGVIVSASLPKTYRDCPRTGEFTIPRFSPLLYCREHHDKAKEAIEEENEKFSTAPVEDKEMQDAILKSCDLSKLNRYEDLCNMANSLARYFSFRKILQFLFLRGGSDCTEGMKDFDDRILKQMRILDSAKASISFVLVSKKIPKKVPKEVPHSYVTYYNTMEKPMADVNWARYARRVRSAEDVRKRQEDKELESFYSSLPLITLRDG